MAGTRFNPFKIPTTCGECGWKGQHEDHVHYKCGMMEVVNDDPNHIIDESKFDINCPLKNFDSDEYMRSIMHLKHSVSKLPEDGNVMVEVKRIYPDGRERTSLESVSKIRSSGKMLILECSTTV